MELDMDRDAVWGTVWGEQQRNRVDEHCGLQVYIQDCLAQAPYTYPVEASRPARYGKFYIILVSRFA